MELDDPLARDDRSPPPRALAVAAAVCAVAMVLALAFLDRPLARALGAYEPLGVWNTGIEVLEWATGYPLWRMLLPVGLVVGMVATVVVRRWHPYAYAWMFVAGTHLATRLATIHLKDGTQRVRPHKWLANGEPDGTFGEGGAAFPSGHGTLFASVAIPLAVLYPKLRVPMLVVAGFVTVARVAVNDHWASDVLASLTLVALVAWLLGSIVRPLRTAPHSRRRPSPAR